MQFKRWFTKTDVNPYDLISFKKTSSEIRNPDGTIVFQLKDIDVPESWSQVAADVLAQKYFRKAGIAKVLKKVPELNIPEWLWRSTPDIEALDKLPADERYSGGLER